MQQTAEAEDYTEDQQREAFKRKFAAYAALTVAALIAAGTFLVAKDATSRFTPNQLGYFRITLSFFLIAPLALPRLKKPTGNDWWFMVLIGLTGITGNQLLFLNGIHLAPPIDGALLYAFTPAVVLLGARIFLGERTTPSKLMGIAIAIVGVVLVLKRRGLNLDASYLVGDLMIAMAVITWAAYTLLGKKLIYRYGALSTNFWGFAIGMLSVQPMALWVFEDFSWQTPGWAGWLGLAYLSGMTSVVSFTLWTWALRYLEAGQVSVFTNLQPVLTALLAWAFLGDIPGPIIVTGGILIILGVTLAQRRTSNR